MKKTALGLKKPEGTDLVNIQDINDNMDIIERELQARPETTGTADEMTVNFSQASKRENIITKEKLSTILGKIQKFFNDLTAAAFAQMITSKADLLATKATGYLPDAKAVAEAIAEVDGYLLASASANGRLSDALNVNLKDPNSDLHKPHLVGGATASTNQPSDLSYGIREVFWSSTNYLIVKITGVATDGNSAVWTRHYSNGWKANWSREITSGTIGSQSVNHAASAGEVAWSGITGKPDTYPPSSHSHESIVSGFFENIAYYATNVVPCHGSMIKRDNGTCDIHLQFSILKMDARSDIMYQFISVEKLCNIFGVSSLGWSTKNTTVQSTNMSAMGNYTGYTGLMFEKSSDNIRFARIYTASCDIGGWELDKKIYDEGIIYNVDIYGATYK